MVERVAPNENEEVVEAEEPAEEVVEDFSHEEIDGLVDMDKAEAIAYVKDVGEITFIIERFAHEINECFVDAEKFDSGVKASAARIRKRLLYLQKVSAVVRGGISAIKADM